jgi:1-acyl-sn-glycerol-3-phosphate acyltransferase
MLYPFWKTWWKLNGWSFSGESPYNIKKAVVIVGPHTSWKDLIVGLAARNVLKIDHIKFMGKKELFRGPLGWFLSSAGGTPVDRKNSNGIVKQAVDLFNTNDEFILALSPEGTRKKVNRLRTGFYFIAKNANVPIVMVGLDFTNKQVIISEPFHTTDDKEEDFNHIHSFFMSVRGRFPEHGLQHFKATSGIIYSFKDSLSHQ